MDHDWLFIMILQWEISSYIFSGKPQKISKLITTSIYLASLVAVATAAQIIIQHILTQLALPIKQIALKLLQEKNREMFSFKSFQIFFLGAVSIFRQCFRVSLNMTVGTKIVLKKFSWLKNHMTTNFVQLMTLLTATIIFSIKFFNSSQCFVCMKSSLPNKPEKISVNLFRLQKIGLEHQPTNISAWGWASRN